MDEDKKVFLQAFYEPTKGEDRAPYKVNEAFTGFDAIVACEIICSELQIKDEDDIVLIDPTSNFPTHALAMFEYLATNHDGRLTVMTGDISNVDATEALRRANKFVDERHKFSFQKWDVEELPIKRGTVDIFIDRSAMLWHAQDKEKVIQLLEKTWQYLKFGGSLVIDAYDNSVDRGGALWSTEQIIKMMCGDQFWDNEQVQRLFNTKLVGEGKYRMRLLIKK